MNALEITLRYGIPSLGVFMSTAIYASSFPIVRQARILRDMRHLDAVTLTIQFLNAQGWLEYARVVNDPFIWASNSIGFILTTLYVVTLLELAVANGQLLARGKVEVIYGVGLIVLIVISTLNSFVFLSQDLRALVTGLLANLLSILMAVAPALNVVAAVRQRSAACIQIGLNVASLLSGLTWASYGLFAKGDPFIYVSAIVGLVSSIAQLVTVMVFYKADHAKRQLLRKVKSLQKLKTTAIQEQYEKRYGEQAGLVPLEYHSEFLAERLNLRAETGLPATDAQRHETAATALLNRPIHQDMAEAVIRDLALTETELALVVRLLKGEETGSQVEPNSPHERIQDLLANLHHTNDVVYHPEAEDPERPRISPSSSFHVSLYPKDYSAVLGEVRQSLAQLSSVHREPSALRPTIQLRMSRQGPFTIRRHSMGDEALLSRRQADEEDEN